MAIKTLFYFPKHIFDKNVLFPKFICEPLPTSYLIQTVEVIEVFLFFPIQIHSSIHVFQSRVVWIGD